MLCLMLPNLFVGCLGFISVLIFLAVLIMVICSILRTGNFEDNIGWFVVAFILFIVGFIVNLVGWFAVWMGK